MDPMLWHIDRLLSLALTVVRESPPMLSMWPCKHVSHFQRISSLLLTFFPTPTHTQLKLGLQAASRWETTNSNPLEWIKLSSQWETGTTSQKIQIDCVYLDYSRAPWELSKLWVLYVVLAYVQWMHGIGLMNLIQIASAGSHTEHWWRGSLVYKSAKAYTDLSLQNRRHLC
jgi:hypothetical protein